MTKTNARTPGGAGNSGRGSSQPRTRKSIMRFLCVGLTGLSLDLIIFTLLHGGNFPVLSSLIPSLGLAPLPSRLISMGLSTLVTWMLNRHFTFKNPAARKTSHSTALEMVRYGLVTLVAQGTNFGIFALLVYLMPNVSPQIFLLTGSALAAFISFEGHRLFSFRHKP